MRTLLASAVACAALAAPSAPTHANTFTAAFSPVRIHAKPGDVVTTKIAMKRGPGATTMQFSAKAEDWWRNADGLTTYYRPAGTLRRSCAEWISLDPVEQEVPPGGRLDVRVTVTVPPDVGPGGYWCAATIDEIADPRRVAKRTGVSFVASFSTGVYVYIAPLERDATITDVRVSGGELEVALRGEANTPLHVSGHVELRAQGGDAIVATVDLARNVLLPEPIGATVLRGKLPDAATLPDGDYRARSIVDIGVEHYLGADKGVTVHRDATAPTP